ncbi:MAG TPA: cytochrome c [Candidatus Kapabacteria bacterium]|nr:cytochrome c [Candidatus Kapabacteria bacterium]
MNKLRIYFAVLSALFLIVLAISPLKDFTRAWKSYQEQYNKLITTLPQRVAPTEIGIKQIWVQDLDRVDRCTTCHLGMKNNALKDAPQPFRTHPKIYHDVEEFGCTACHGGQGLATDVAEAHGKVEHWDSPMLSAKYMEASCAKCHKGGDVPQASVLNLGRSLIEKYNCTACHKLNGYDKQWVPPLDGIGSKVNRAWLFNWLKDPKAYFPGTRMPNFMLSDSDANTLADFLMSFKSPASGAAIDSLPSFFANANADQKAKLSQLGETRISEARCISCHAINGKGGYVATDLGKVASKVNPAWLYNYIKDPKHLLPGVEMPRFRLTDQELAGVVAYMQGNFVDYDMQQPPDHTPDPDFYEKGLALFKKYNCSGCHQLGNMNHAEEMAPDLTEIGSKKIYEVDFGASHIEQTLPTYLETKLLTPRVFTPTMKMPKFGFSEEQARAITVALLGNTTEPIPDKYVVNPNPKPTFVPQGEFGKLVKDLSCMTCHKMNGHGGTVAPDLSIEASQAQPDWIETYFKVPYSLRPILTERMPNFFLSDGERKALLAGIENLFIADSIEHTVPANDSVITRGKGLYFERYACQSCHQISGAGGYVGPPLDKIGTRLKPGWVFHWLKNPQAYKPESIEPNNKMTDGDADAITAYLMTLK